MLKIPTLIVSITGVLEVPNKDSEIAMLVPLVEVRVVVFTVVLLVTLPIALVYVVW